MAEIELKLVGFTSYLHLHDTTAGHSKRQVLTTPTEEGLFSQCFCGVYGDRANSVDMNHAV